MEQPGVNITLKMIYDEVRSLNTRVDLLVHRQAEAEKDSADHEDRLRSLEKARWPIPSAAVLVSIASLVLAFVKGG